MIFERHYLGCLAQASFLIGSEGLAAVVDPRRDVAEYLARADELGLRIEWILLTHVHADFVAGHLELAQATGAQIAMSRRAEVGFGVRPLADGEVIRIGAVEIRAIETPGHTPDSMCFLVVDTAAADGPPKLLTGDTLFLGDVGRPDLVGSIGFSAADMAGMMYDSLHAKILPLDDAVEVFPGHGAGSACGKNIQDAASCTLGEQRASNYALAPMSRAEFVTAVTEDQSPPPNYFAHAAAYNKRGAAALAELDAVPRVSLAAAEQHASAGHTVLDVRSATAYGEAHVPGSINIGLAGQFASWCGTLLDFESSIVLVCDDEEQRDEARMRLARVGLENVGGWLPAAEAGDEVTPQISVTELHDGLGTRFDQLIDVRRRGEWQSGHARGAVHAPLSELADAALEGLDRRAPTAVICGSGYRSSAAMRRLRSAGFTDLYNVIGGTNAWRAKFDVVTP